MKTHPYTHTDILWPCYSNRQTNKILLDKQQKSGKHRGGCVKDRLADTVRGNKNKEGTPVEF